MEFEKLEVGKVVSRYIGHAEGTQFDIDGAGASLTLFFNHPTEHEVEQCKAGNKFEIRFVEAGNVIMLLFKIGELNWMDAPYTPHLGAGFTGKVKLKDGCGLALTITLVDCKNGVVKSIRLIGLGEKFTKKLLKATYELKEQDFSKAEYAKAISKLYMYSTNQLTKMAGNDYYKIDKE